MNLRTTALLSLLLISNALMAAPCNECDCPQQPLDLITMAQKPIWFKNIYALNDAIRKNIIAINGIDNRSRLSSAWLEQLMLMERLNQVTAVYGYDPVQHLQQQIEQRRNSPALYIGIFADAQTNPYSRQLIELMTYLRSIRTHKPIIFFVMQGYISPELVKLLQSVSSSIIFLQEDDLVTNACAHKLLERVAQESAIL